MQPDIQDIDRQPIAEQNAMVEQVPVIDLADFFQDASSSAALSAIDQIAQACKTWGFFHVVNHGIASKHIKEVWNHTYAVKDPMAGLDQHETADLGIHHHTDAGGLTVLLQDQVSGLQGQPTTVGD